MKNPCNVKLCTAALAMFLAACRVGPKYTKPAPPAPAPAFKESSPNAYKSVLPGAWQPARPQDAQLKGKWWEIFHEPELNALEEQLNINNQNIAQFFQNFMAARAQVGEARAQYFPAVTFDPTITESRAHAGGFITTTTTGGTGIASGGSSTSSANTFTNITLPFDATWAPDLWGRVRNTVRESQYAAQVSAADLENERLTEQAALAEFYFQLRGQDTLQDIYNKTIEADKISLDLTRSLVQTGIDSPEAEAQAEVVLQNAEEAGAGVATNRAIYEHAIATLTGKPASSFSMPVKFLTTPVPPIPVGVPSELLQRRPDIAAAERTMAEANALIGVETAAYYPTVNLTASGGVSATAFQTLFSLPAVFWSVGASASQIIFDAGLRKSTIAQYTAQYNADAAAYKQSVLTAFQQVEDYIATLRTVSDQIVRQKQAIEAAQQNLKVSTARYETGLDPYLNVMTAQLLLLSNQLTQINLRMSEMTAAVQLIQALGGGWNASELPTPSQVTSKRAAAGLAH